MLDLALGVAAQVKVFMTDAADHITGKTGLTLTIEACKPGGNWSAITPTVVDKGYGTYTLDLTDVHLDTQGVLALHITGTGADPTDVFYNVKPAATVSIAGSAPISVFAQSFTLTTGIETNSYLNTKAADGVAHIIDDVGNTIDGYYRTFIGYDGLPVNVTILGNLQSANDTLSVMARGGSSGTWRQIGTLPGTGGTTLAEYEWPLNETDVGVGADAGIIDIRFVGGSSNPRLDIDTFAVGKTVVAKNYSYIGQAQAGGASSITFPATASALPDFYRPGYVTPVGGTGVGQGGRRIESYDGATKVATLATPWVTQPDATTIFTVTPFPSVRVSDIDAGVVDATAAPLLGTIDTGVAANNTLSSEIRAYLRNKKVLDRSTGIETVYNDAGAVLYTRQVYSDEAGAVPYDGNAAPHRVERFT